jgi:hypothetical protein
VNGGLVGSVMEIRPRLKSSDLASIGQKLAQKLPDLSHDSLMFENELEQPIEALRRFISISPPDVQSPAIAATKLWVVHVAERGMCRRWSPTPQNIAPALKSPPLLPTQLFNSYIAPLSVSKSVAIRDNAGDAHYVGVSPADPGYLPAWAFYDRMLSTLNEGPGDTPAGSDRWRVELRNCIRVIATWRDDPKNPEYYLEKASLLLRLIALKQDAPPEAAVPGSNGLVRSAAADPTILLIQFLDGDVADAVFRGRRAVWFAPVMYALGSAGHNAQMDKELKVARNPVLRMYGTLGELLSSVHRVYH